ncbi:MAG: GDP-mannose 4,6-dehydratase [Candidatus Stahlbacteria bacterium]|nr:GDP-mannose 4,6-dehydratase [Candidatus Stahlbacteria bacterium]
MKILVTGVTGFAGSHLVDYLLTLQGVEIFGIKRWRSRTENIEHFENRISLYECDIKDASSVRNAIEEIRPERIFHLAAQSYVPTSWNAPTETLEINIMGQLNIFEAVRRTGIDPIIQIAGSSEEYGYVKPDELPIKETNPLRPLSPYAVSKVAQDMMAYQYFMNYGIKVIRTRAFNHTGPRRPSIFVCSDFAHQIVEIEKGKKEPEIHVGNLESIRDFTDVRDIVKAYWLACEKCSPGEIYNICSSKGWKIKDALYKLIELSGVKDIKIVQEGVRLRPTDVPVLCGDCEKFKKQTGWQIEIPFEQTLQDLLHFWREKI